MVRSERRVVITGIGLITPIGTGPAAVWAALSSGRSGVDRIRQFPIDGLSTDAAGEIPDFDPKALVSAKHKTAFRKSLKYMARDIQLAVAGAELAVADAGLLDGGVDPTRFGVDLGAGLISTELDELAPAINLATREDDSFDYHAYGKDAIPLIPPIWLLKYLPNMLACHISILMDCQGPSNSITEAEAASNTAIGEATRIIASGRADVMISGGADSKIHPLSLIRMSLLGQMSHWQGDPRQACRPFDARRDGWIAGEGAGILVLEEYEHAKRRGATIHGEILGYGSGCDANPRGGIDPSGIGTEIAVRAALRDAQLEPSAIGHVNAHGAATVEMDLAEARALNRVFGAEAVPVTALKGYMGNLVSGCGAVELVCSLLGVNRGSIPGTLNCDDPDPECRLDLVRGEPRETSNPIFLNTNFTRHGQAAALVVRGEPSAS
ncbi:MAG: beta-ketoacyl-[acyl-carrier-protein] synthase family protein [Isosphaeraceae bacterium]|nr:beta-ketoacyl-[acyl-carrier-protein] synthase family protein [Isosphaeraceae bacterium]